MAGFGVGVMHNTISSRFGPKPLVHRVYAIGLARRADLHALEPAAQSVGGRGAGAPRFRVQMTVCEGARSQDREEQLASDVHTAVCTAAAGGPEGERALHVWTLIHELAEGDWAGGGKIIYYRRVKGLVADDAE